MAKPPNIPVLRESELGIKDGPVNGVDLREAFQRFFAQVNASFDLTNKSLSKGVTLTDNLRCDVVAGQFTHGVAQQVALHTLTKAQSAWVLGADGQLPLFATVTMVQRTSQPGPLANVTIWFNDSTASKVKCAIALLPDGQQTSTTPTFLEAIPKSIYCSAEYNTTAAQSINSGATTIIDFGTKVKDTDTAVTTGASWHFTVPASKGGDYAITAVALINGATGTDPNLYVYKNGAAYAALQDIAYSAAPASGTVSGSATITGLAAGDTIDVRLNHNAGVARSLTANATQNRITIVRLSGS